MNFKMFGRALAYIEAHPEQWDQTNPDESECAHCLLAHVRTMAGIPRPESTFEAGADALEIPRDGEMADWLFSSERTLDDFRTVARTAWATL